jgi:hypothetical protein
MLYFAAMKGLRFGIITRSISLISMASLAIALCGAPALCADSSAASSIAKPAAVSAPMTTDSPAVHKSLRKKVKAAVMRKVDALRALRDKEFAKASSLFPTFCQDWQRKLHDREVNNEEHIAWQQKDGWETGTYTGYGPIKNCECHQSSDGYSIGKVTYDELKYYVTGKTPDEAKHAAPRVTDDTATTELFRWDKEAWFY